MAPRCPRPRSRAHLLLVAGLGIGLLAACGAGSTRAAAPESDKLQATAAPSSTTLAVSSLSLLDKASLTVLGQAVAYPAALPAQVSSGIVTLAPGAQTGLHRHEAPIYAYVLEGTVTVEYDGGITKAYSAGTAFMEAVGTAHNGRNLGGVPVRILTLYIGAQGVHNTVTLP